MKVRETGTAPSAGPTRRKKKADAQKGVFAEKLRNAQAGSGAEAAAEPAAEPAALPTVDSILAVQEVPDVADGRSRGLLRQHGDDLLNRLDELRLAILAGTVAKDELTELAQKLRQKRQQSDDPKLNEIIDEIELRAEVEIAKLTR